MRLHHGSFQPSAALWTVVVAGLLLVSSSAAQEVRIERDVPARMRDGVVLRADVYRPAEGGPYPVQLERTPYGKQGVHPEVYVRAGYIVVCQDARGRHASEGTYESFVRAQTHDAEDGYDTVEWAARLPGSTGKVGTFGASYNAFLQWRLAALRPPSLVAMSAQSIPARYTDLEGPGTIRPGRRLCWWVTTMSPDLRRKAGRPGTTTSAAARALWDAGEDRNWLGFLPWLDLPDRVFEDEAPAVRAWLRHPDQDPWKLDDGCPRIEVPNLDVVGWYDHCHGDFLLYRTMVERGATETARRGQRIVIGPWNHSGRGIQRCGDFDFGPEAAVDVKALEIRWFDHWLKGKSSGVDTEAPVRLFVMGANRWRDEQEWPLQRARPLALYLDGSGHANGPDGDGRLVAGADRPARAAVDHYRYDPRDPVPSLHGTPLFTIPTDQRPLAFRADILVYQTAPLETEVEVTGYPEVELFAASSAPDTDFFARLVDVAPDGEARDVALGMVRARYRHSLTRPELLTPGAVMRYAIRMGPTANLFRAGHRIRLDITSSDFPNYDRNHNTAADQNADATLAVAEQMIHHGGTYASKLILPRIPPVDPVGDP
jgi:putative CocE/NonD family hydrolase